jgi:hypothetical protein
MDRDTVVRMMRHFLSPVVTKAVAASVVGCALLGFSTQARAQDPATAPPPAPAAAAPGALGQGFGETGQIAISNEGFVGFDKTNNVGWGLTLKPAADYFLMPAVSVGLVAAYAQGNGDAKAYAVGARAGYNLNLTENVGVWPKAGVAYQHNSVGNASFATTWVTFFVPLLYHIVPHFFVGLAPYYNVKVAGDGNHNYGFSYVIGGWF